MTVCEERELYVIQSSHGYSCWGFEQAWEQTRVMLQLLGDTKRQMQREKLGSLEFYEFARQVQKDFAGSKHAQYTWFPPKTPQAICHALELARKKAYPVRIWYGDASGQSWLEEHDTVGRVGRSTGTLKVPLLVPAGECGGGAILCDRILRIRREDTGADIYRHPEFHLPWLEIRGCSARGYLAEIARRRGPGAQPETEVHSRHRTYAEACGLLAWLAGEEHRA